MAIMRRFVKPCCLIALLMAPITGHAQQQVSVPNEPGYFCTMVLGFGTTLGGFCEDPNAKQDLPQTDPDALNFKLPEPLPEPEPPSFAPVVIEQPPKVVERVVEKIVIKEVPAPPPPEPPPPPAIKIDPIAEAIKASMMTRRNDQSLANTETIPIMPKPKASLTTLTNDPFNPSPSFNQEASLGRLYGNSAIPSIVQDGIYQQEFRESSLPKDNTRILTNDRYLTGILETGINSQLGATQGNSESGVSSVGVIIQISRDTYGYHGRKKLVPKGSRLVCDYIAPDAEGISRIGIICNRLLLAGSRAEVYDLSAIGTDVQGRDGITGNVDNRFFEKYGTAFVLAGISAGVRLSTAAISDGDEEDNATGEILDAGSEELSEKLGEITASVLEESVNLNPIVTIPQGTRVTIRPKLDIVMKKVTY